MKPDDDCRSARNGIDEAVNTLASVPIALGGAASLAVSSILQQRDARQSPAEESLSWRLIADLVHRRMWLVGMGCVLVGFALQATALSFAPVAVVEPLMATELVLALPLATRLRRRRMGVREWTGAVAVSAGIAVFLAVSSPTGGNPEPRLLAWTEVALPVLAVALCLIALAGRDETPRRAMLLAAAAGLGFSLLALVLQSLVVLFTLQGIGALASWQPYAMALLGPVGFTVAQSAYQAAPLAVSLPILDSVEPTGAVVLSALLFHQSIAMSPLSLGLEAAAAAVAVAGIFLLGRSPLVLSIYERQQKQKESSPETSKSRSAG